MTATLSDLIDAPRPAARGGAAPGWQVPQVDLLPPEVTARRRVRRVQRLALMAGGMALSVVAAGWLVAAGQVGSAQADLDDARAQVATLQAEQATYAAAPQTIAQVESVELARTAAMTHDVRWYAYLDSLVRALPEDSWMVSLTAELADGEARDPAALTTGAAPTTTAAGAAGAAAGEAAATEGIGTVTIAAKSTSYEDVADYLDALARVPGVSDAYLTTSTRDESGLVPVVSYAVTAVVTQDALSHRFDSPTDPEVG